MKKILLGLMALAVVLGIAGVGTVAYFSDTEISSGNTFTAGTVNLTVDGNDNTNTVEFTVANIAPGSSGVGTWTLVNAGSIAGFVDLESISEVSTEGLNPESETGDTGEPGELGLNLDVVLFWDDGAGSGTLNNGVQDGTEVTIYSGALDGILSSYGADYPLAVSATTYVSMTWSVDTAVGNDIQGDVSTLGMTFELAQTAGQ